ncbi:MAG TPA: transcriptional regulator [Cyanobacteria bacterium UBA8803]|nr:transcriptional regulator [Cyanobacteria bacterium UBA9273]HBL61740.1 transcriptional regulator [Cyanobacteria bacterium UBA8803]
MRVLLVEDDERLSVTLVTVLLKQHYLVDVVKDSQEAFQFLDTFAYDLVLLDIVLPGVDGITLCQQLRARGLTIPILLLTARDDTTDKVKGLDAGADDYLVKPFDLQEFLARIRALLRRGSSPILSSLEWGDLRLIPSTREASYGNQSLSLTLKEYRLLELFLRNNHRVFSCDDLIQDLWSFEDPPTESTIRSHIRGLRNKLKAAGASPDLVETVYGVGYRLKELGGTRGTRRSGEPQNLEDKERQTLAALARRWEQFRTSIFEDVDFLERAIREVERQTTPFLQPQAIATAHNLVGLLGSLRLADAARICREIEILLLSEIAPNSENLLQLQEQIQMLRQVLAESSPATVPSTEAFSPTIEPNLPVVLAIDDDPELTEQLRQLGSNWGLQIEVATSLATGRERLRDNRPDLIILDLCFPEELEDGLTLLAQLSESTPRIPVVVLTIRGALSDRLEAARAEAVAFLHKPFSPEQVLAIVHQTLQQSRPLAAKILVVDDDSQFLSLLRTSLASEELQLTTLSDPRQFWETLETVVPDLLVLDLEMSDLNGIDLCRVVRNDPRWNDLPILFLTAHINRLNVEQIVAAGADDFISKSALSLELQIRIFSHLQRVRRLRQMAQVRTGIGDLG